LGFIFLINTDWDLRVMFFLTNLQKWLVSIKLKILCVCVCVCLGGLLFTQACSLANAAPCLANRGWFVKRKCGFVGPAKLRRLYRAIWGIQGLELGRPRPRYASRPAPAFMDGEDKINKQQYYY
jgi:hypothetical protein